MTAWPIRSLTAADAPAVHAAHQAAASVPDSGLARAPDEITLAYVEAVIAKASRDGVALGAFDGPRLLGEVHAVRLGPRQFAHVLTDLTVAVHPDAQGRGVGKALFAALFSAAGALDPVATRIELVARSGNIGALRLYQSLGFVAEGRFRGRVRLPDGRVEDDIPMAWSR